MRTALIASLLLACSGQTPAPLAATSPQPPVAVAVAPAVEVGAATLALPDIAERTVKSVVSIATERAVTRAPAGLDHPFFDFRLPQQPQRRQSGQGSGVVVAPDRILTNHHVIDGAEQIRVVLHDGRRFDAELVGSDSRSDVAVLRLVEPPDDLAVLPWGDSKALRLGETVLAVGNPFGMGHSVSRGIVSAKGRGSVGIVDYEDFIQTDAAINPGNSGGALVNLQGELVGINTAIMSRSGGSQGIGFAIPAHLAERIADDLAEEGVVRRGWLGVSIQDVDEPLARALDLPDRQGVLIGGVADDGAAADAGVKAGDVVRSLNGESVVNVGDFRNRIALSGPGAPFELEVMRDGRLTTVSGALAAHPDDAKAGATDPTAPPKAALGLKLRAEDDGLRVLAVEPGSASERAGLRRGDLIVEVNRQRATVSRLEDGSGELLLWIRSGQMERFVVLAR